MEKGWGTGKKYSKKLTWTHEKKSREKVVENMLIREEHQKQKSKYLQVLYTCHFRRKKQYNP